MNHVRPARPADGERIAALYGELVNDPAVKVLPERIGELAGDPRTGLFVCERAGRVEGCVLVSLCADVMFGRQPFAVLENVVVSSACRGLGVGTALLRYAEAFCLQADCSKMMLLSAAHRGDAHRFFERAGFSGKTKRGFVKYRRHFSPLDLAR